MILYQGPSLYNGDEIVVIAQPSWNKKTGTMLGTWILPLDTLPSEAAAYGSDKDESVCGFCRYRATKDGRPCYVRMEWDSDVLWKRLHAGEFEEFPADQWQRKINPLRMAVRLGSYGDPAAVPTDVWVRLTSTADRFTGYTHLWDWENVDVGLKRFCMASVDTPEQRDKANKLGWRTFHVVTNNSVVSAPIEILCPASEEHGRATTCDRCRLCMGTSLGKGVANIYIPAHGPGKHLIQAENFNGVK